VIVWRNRRRTEADDFLGWKWIIAPGEFALRAEENGIMVMKKMRKSIGALAVIAALSMLPSLAMADPEVGIDGRLGTGEYTTAYDLTFRVEGGGSHSSAVPGNGQLYYRVDGQTVSLAFVQPKTLVDNSYGEYSVGWKPSDPTAAAGHAFGDLLESDVARFVFLGSEGSTTTELDVTLDYLYETGAATYSSGVGGEGGVDVGNVLAAATSLDYNLKKFGTGNNLTVNSPKTLNQTDSADASYGLDAADPRGIDFTGWVFDVVYEMQVDISAFGGDVTDLPSQMTIGFVHDSPNKIDQGKVEIFFGDPDTAPGVIPEPLTMFGLICGVGGLGGYLRRRFGAKV